MIYLLTICFLIGKVISGDGSCSVSLPSSDERSCDYGRDQQDSVGSQQKYRAAQSSHTDKPAISRSEYQKALNDAQDGKLEEALPTLRKGAESFNSGAAWNNLCAFLLDYGHTHGVIPAEVYYKEAEKSCNAALAIDPNNNDAIENLEGLRKSREIRGILVGSTTMKPTAGRFVGQRPKKSMDRKMRKKAVVMGFNDVYTPQEEALRIYPGKMDNGDLKFKLYNGSTVDPRGLTLHLGEVYVEDGFISESERSGLMAIIDRGLLEEDGSVEKGPVGSVLAGKILSIGSQLTKEEQLLIARLRERVVNRANDFRGVNTPMYSYTRGVRAHATSILRYKENGRHNVHHDNDFINRCLTASIALNDGFEGGEFNLHTTKNVHERTLEGFPIIGTVTGRAGRLLLFQAQSINSVSEVKSGVRDTLLVWMTCDIDAEYQLDHPLEFVDDRKVWKASA